MERITIVLVVLLWSTCSPEPFPPHPESVTAEQLQDCILGRGAQCRRLADTLTKSYRITSGTWTFLLTRACRLDDAQSCLTLARDLTNLPQHELHFVRARWALERGCKLQVPESCFGLAWSLLVGVGGPRRHWLARSVLTNMCQSGHADACVYAARLLLEEVGGNRAPARALRHLALARDIHREHCEEGRGLACKRALFGFGAWQAFDQRHPQSLSLTASQLQRRLHTPPPLPQDKPRFQPWSLPSLDDIQFDTCIYTSWFSTNCEPFRHWLARPGSQ